MVEQATPLTGPEVVPAQLGGPEAVVPPAPPPGTVAYRLRGTETSQAG